MLDQLWQVIALVVAIAVIGVGLVVGLLRGRRGKAPSIPAPTTPTRPGGAGRPGASGGADDEGGGVATLPGGPVTTTPGAEAPALPDLEAPAYEKPESARGRLARLRARLARSNSAIGKGLLALLSRGGLDEAAWEDVEDTLLTADLGVEATTELVESLKTKVKVEGTTDESVVRGWLREDLLRLVDPTMDRRVASTRVGDRPAVVLVVGVNGTGKTTTVGKLARWKTT